MVPVTCWAPTLLGANTAAFLDKSAFVSLAAFSYGNTPRTGAYGISGPSFWGQDLSLKRSFPIHEKIGVLLQMDAINAFNIVMFGVPALNITSANFGKITSQANGPRIVQLSARLTFEACCQGCPSYGRKPKRKVWTR